ncbi:MAG: caspase family protein [Candidatus Riflebacteria bacterium]|nr:caspase family protein [Candidatus Riflebacteria bacterium]
MASAIPACTRLRCPFLLLVGVLVWTGWAQHRALADAGRETRGSNRATRRDLDLSAPRKVAEPFTVKLRPDRGQSSVYEHQARIAMTLSVSHPSWVYLLNFGTSGRLVPLLPNELGQSHRLDALREVRIPPKEFGQLVGAAGVERFVAVAAREQLPELEGFFGDLLAGASGNAGTDCFSAVKDPKRAAVNRVDAFRDAVNRAAASRGLEAVFDVGTVTHLAADGTDPVTRVRVPPPGSPDAGPDEAGRVVVLSIGVGQYPNNPKQVPLRYATKDARAFDALMAEMFRIPPERRRLLLDDKATRAAFVEAFTVWLPRVVSPRDTVFIYYSGHGLTFPDPHGDERDGLEEALVPSDAAPDRDVGKAAACLVSDDDLRLWVQQLRCARLGLILDSCFGGGMARSVGTYRMKSIPWHVWQQPAFAGSRGFGPKDLGGSSDTVHNELASEGKSVLLAAAQECQQALEVYEEPVSGGLFTYFLLNGLRTKQADADRDGMVDEEEALRFVETAVQEFYRTHPGCPRVQPALDSALPPGRHLVLAR